MKRTTINKRLSQLLVLFLLMGFSSCEDWFTLTPESEMIASDFWKDGDDVLSAVGSCYRAMEEESFIKRLIVWGEVRSDNVVGGKNSETDLTYLLNANINAANSYARWNDFYLVINYCNTVIKNAPAVTKIDPNFSEKTLRQYLAEAKAIRAFCYFTLVRTFNSVPYITEPYLDDSRDYKMPQSSATEILNALIADLHSIENDAITVYSNEPYTKGRVTQKAVWSLMADIYLWLEDYENCALYCDKVMQSNGNPLNLTRSSIYYASVFFNGNSEESIWELQFNSNLPNGGVRDFYGGSSTDPKLASVDQATLSGTTFFEKNDLRRINSYVEADGYFLIKKYIAWRQSTNTQTIRASEFSYGSATNNWILYRLSDIYLMKAEALAEMGSEADLAEAAQLVTKVYSRANPDLEEVDFKSIYTSQEQVRDLVFDERQRELLFEGKRYFDLVRRMRREGTPTNVINTYLLKKYAEMSVDQTTVMSKLNDVDAIYMPIYEEELLINTLLKQNRFYEVSSDITR